ncbi:MAG: hypothetical protein HY755_09805 [Nitrospirae bacterium]|nr:hypothetical protein [Nitrospirota bacterium]
MRVVRFWLFFSVLVISAAFILTGCSNGGGGVSAASSTGSALTIADRVSVVDAQSSPGKMSALLKELYLTTFDLPSTSQYFTDAQTVYVEERSAEAFDIVNEIMCMTGQSKYGAMVNKGNYKAQIDMNLCSKNSDNASSAGQSSQNQSSGSTAPNYEKWTVNSSRADNNSPHIVKVWMHEEADEYEPAKVIYIKMTITEAVSSTNPYGIFTMNFDAYPEAGGARMFRGYLKTERDTATNKVLLKFVVSGGFSGSSFDEKIVLDRAVDGSTGSGTTYMSDTWGGESKKGYFNIAFNNNYFRRYNVTSSDDKCFSRTTFDSTVWRYGLYNSSGNRVELNSGFPIKTTGNAYGWIGYYGMWFSEGVTPPENNTTVYKVAYSQSGETLTPYTVIKKGGKLKKHTRHTTTLSNIKNIPLDGWMEGTYPNQTSYRVKWDSTAQQFIKFAQQNTTTYMWENITEAAVDLSTIQFGELNFWSQSIGGQVRVKLSCTGWDNTTNKPICSAPNNSTQIIYFTETPIFPGDTVPSSLRCYENCPIYNATTGVTSSGWGGDPTNPTAYNYAFSSASTNMILKDGSNRDMILTTASGSNQWGFMSGPMFDPSGNTTDLNGNTITITQALDCNWDNDNNPATNPATCTWNAWSALSTYYTWETGPNQWNQFTALVDSGGTPLTFSPPMQVSYTHTQTDATKPDYKYNGTKFYLEYSGFGNLWGIPGKCVAFDTGAEVSCGPNTRWIPEYSILDGSELTNSADGTTKYLAKALEKEQRMSVAADANCTALTLTSYTLPDILLWEDPAIGSEPTVTNAPAVIGGVLQ